MAALALPLPVAAAELFVAPGGLDTNPGTADQPFASIVRAQEAVRQLLNQGSNEGIYVWLREGTHELANALVFTPADGGTVDHSVTFSASPGEIVILSGGRPITGWQRGPAAVWTTAAPSPSRKGGFPFRNLYVGPRRAVRAGTPNADARPNCVQLTGASLSDDRRLYTLTLPPEVLRSRPKPWDLEAMVTGNWAINRKRVQSIDAGGDSWS